MGACFPLELAKAHWPHSLSLGLSAPSSRGKSQSKKPGLGFDPSTPHQWALKGTKSMGRLVCLVGSTLRAESKPESWPLRTLLIPCFGRRQTQWRAAWSCLNCPAKDGWGPTSMLSSKASQVFVSMNDPSKSFLLQLWLPSLRKHSEEELLPSPHYPVIPELTVGLGRVSTRATRYGRAQHLEDVSNLWLCQEHIYKRHLNT